MEGKKLIKIHSSGLLKFKMVQMSQTWHKHKVTLASSSVCHIKLIQTLPALFLPQLGNFRTNLRSHVKQVPHGHIGVALAVAVALCEEFVLGPGHVNPLRTSFCLVIYGSMGRRVAVVDELSLKGRWRKRGEEKKLTTLENPG